MIQGFASQSPDGPAVQQLELLIRTAIFKPANELAGVLFQQAADRIDAAYQPKPGWARKGRVAVKVQGIFGVFELKRDYYYHAGQKPGFYPTDAALGLEGGSTPALARLICLEGADETSFQKAESHLRETGGIAVEGRQIQRVIQRIGPAAQQWQQRTAQSSECDPERVPILYVSGDGTGVPMRPCELEGRKGKQADGTAKTRQAYLGCVFTQHRTDEEGHPVRDWESTTYVSSMAGIGDFGPCLRQEAMRRGMGTARQTVLLIDGASGLENMGHDCFKDATQIVDFYHALEHGGQVVEALLGNKQHPEYKGRLEQWAKGLLKDKVKHLIEKARTEALERGRAQNVEETLGYFERNIQRMQYGTFRKRGFFIGSGVIEAGCKTVVGARCKQSGMFWSTPGAENILALRCIHASHRLDAFWKYRLNQKAALNDALALAA